ncbi:MAG: AAA family ATPase, partial [Chloroflexi bacterium]|nr:AAA family ATPase [Chloroflexota bacterium]
MDTFLPAELSPTALRAICDPKRFAASTTTEMVPSEGIIGQPRATAALQFGLGMTDGGYHIFVAGPPGTGKMTAIKTFLSSAAKGRPSPTDICYVYNFSEPDRPRILVLPPSRGRQLAHDLDNLLRIARSQLPRAFESEEYTSQREALTKRLEEARANRFAQLDAHARDEGFTLQPSPMGLMLIPLVRGKPMSDKDFEGLSPEQREHLQEKRTLLESEIGSVLKWLREQERATRESIEHLDHEVALHVIGGLLDDITESYADLPDTLNYLAAIRQDMIDQVDLFRVSPEETGPLAASFLGQREQAFRRYRVNVIVEHSVDDGAPVVVESNPTYQNLIGRVEKEAQFGALVTDSTLIRGGALHRANGGYLVLRIEELLQQPFYWRALKRALRNREVAIEDESEWLGFSTVKTLRPEPLPLNVKVVLVGEQATYVLLHTFDLDFSELFRVRADFDVAMPRTPDNETTFAQFICRICQEENLRPFDRTALAQLVEHASRLAEDQNRLSVQFGTISNLVREANYWAGSQDSAVVLATHVHLALDQQVYRSSLVEERLRELIAEGTLVVDVTGAEVGQINGLAVESLGGYSFGRPSRITATVGVGRDGVLDIEREVHLGGPIHSKGVLILAGFLADRFARGQPLTLSARLVFEQSYGG